MNIQKINMAMLLVVSVGCSTNSVETETAERIEGSKSFKGCFYAAIDRETMARSGVYSKWLEAEHEKYGTKQDSIEGALEELDDI